MTIKHVSSLIHNKQQSEQEKNTSQGSIENDYPTWLYGIFLQFSLVYPELWNRLTPEDVDKDALKSIYFNALKKFHDETIEKATMEYVSRYKFPELHQLVSLCDEFSKTNRYNNNQLEHLPEDFKKTRMPEELRKKMGITR